MRRGRSITCSSFQALRRRVSSSSAEGAGKLRHGGIGRKISSQKAAESINIGPTRGEWARLCRMDQNIEISW
jgi:hypothetical protein